MRQRQEVQEVLPPLRIFPALPTESAVRKLPYRPARSAASQIHGPHDAYVLTCQCLSRRIARQDTLLAETEIWEERRNAARPQIKWQFTTQDARIKLRSLYLSAH